MNKILHYCDCYPEYIGKQSFYELDATADFKKGLEIWLIRQVDWRASFILMESVFLLLWSVSKEMKPNVFRLVIAINFIWRIYM